MTEGQAEREWHGDEDQARRNVEFEAPAHQDDVWAMEYYTPCIWHGDERVLDERDHVRADEEQGNWKQTKITWMPL